MNKFESLLEIEKQYSIKLKEESEILESELQGEFDACGIKFESIIVNLEHRNIRVQINGITETYDLHTVYDWSINRNEATGEVKIRKSPMQNNHSFNKKTRSAIKELIKTTLETECEEYQYDEDEYF